MCNLHPWSLMAFSVPGKVFHCSHSSDSPQQMFPENTCGLFPTGGSCQLQPLRYCHLGIFFGFLLVLTQVKLVWTGQMIFWCMGRGIANESPHGASDFFLPGDQATGSGLIAPSVCGREGAELAPRAFHQSSTHCQQAKVPTFCSCQGAGGKQDWWDVLSHS